MNRNKLKTYAPQARRDFIQAVTDRAAQFGLSAAKIEPMTEKGDVVLISGKPFPKSVGKKRRKLEARIKKDGFEQTIEAMAYTWFNRLVAIRFMELHQYLDHGFRVLSHPAGHSQPEILEHAQHVEFVGLNHEQVVALKLDGNKEEELYRLLLLAQCNALHKAMPFLFESLDDETELLFPDNLLHSDSLIRKLVDEIQDEDWKEVEIIGWLYQFYIRERYEEVIGKVVASKDIPAATQLFTPNWIVKYLVQNTLGRQWLATYPHSALRQEMEYYIEPAEQTPEIQEQLKTITPVTLNPEELTLLDPACGSGHILVEAYDLFKTIYQERGYRAKDIATLILQKNLFGLEIDGRAAQLAAFSLMMKARADDRRIFDSEAKPNVVAFQDSQGMNAADLTLALNAPVSKEDVPTEYLFEEVQEEKDGLFSKKALAEKGDISQADIGSLVELFKDAKTFGSLIQIPSRLAAKLLEIEQRLNVVLTHGDLTHTSTHVLKPLLYQARLLSRQYDVVVANPPYMTSDYMPPSLKGLIATRQKNKRTDLYAVFIQAGLYFTKSTGSLALITRDSWFSLPTFEKLRQSLLSASTVLSAVHLGPRAFEMISGHVVQTVMFTLLPFKIAHFNAVYHRLIDGSHQEKEEAFLARKERHESTQEIYEAIDGSPITYWLSQATRDAFYNCKQLSDVAEVREGIHTGDNERFIRYWWEVDFRRFSVNENSDASIDAHGKKWIPYNKGGKIRKWYGNNELVIAFDFQTRDEMRKLEGHVRYNQHLYYKEGATWTDVGSGFFCVRYYPNGFLFDGKGMAVVAEDLWMIIGLLNSTACQHFANILMPTLNYKCGSVKKIPFVQPNEAERVREIAHAAVLLAKESWDATEASWDFQRSVYLPSGRMTLADSAQLFQTLSDSRITRLTELEKNNNSIFIEAYGLQGELSLDVHDDQITLQRPNQEEDIKRLLSYVIGCTSGRYSLDKPGLIMASHGENLESYLLKVSARSESLHKDRILSELDRLELVAASVNCLGCGSTTTIEDAKFVIAGKTTKEGQLQGRPFIYCARCCDHDRASYVTMSMPLSQFSPKTALEQKWCEPETLKIFLDLAKCFGKRTPMKVEDVKFLPDEDGIIPLMEFSWFADDAANRIEKFIATAWPAEHLNVNLEFVADSLGTKKGETPQEMIRRYLATDFYKHHLSMYKKRPIYWLFSSGKQRGFQALVYLHRYNEGTLARMRTEYVVPLIGKMTARISQLGDEIDATSASPRKKILTTDKATITKQLAEVQAFEEKLRHYADQRIKLDLDDGVKVNYGKFGDLLAEVKAVCGTKEED